MELPAFLLQLHYLPSCYYDPLPLTHIYIYIQLMIDIPTSSLIIKPYIVIQLDIYITWTQLAITIPHLSHCYTCGSGPDYGIASFPVATSLPLLLLLWPLTSHLYNCVDSWIWNLCSAAWCSHGIYHLIYPLLDILTTSRSLYTHSYIYIYTTHHWYSNIFTDHGTLLYIQSLTSHCYTCGSGLDYGIASCPVETSPSPLLPL